MTWTNDGVSARRRLARHISGSGVELGPGHAPYHLPFPGVSVRYVDRWTPAENKELFPELGQDAAFPQPDIVANFDIDRLRPLADQSQDFVIASHVLEHLAEPLGFLEEIERVLRPGGVLVLLLPDRTRTFDANRAPTPLEHLLVEYREHVRYVDDDHVREFVTSVNPYEVPAEPDAWPEVLARHRERSIHVHCWSEREFDAVLEYVIATMKQRWELVDWMGVADGGPGSIEFGYVLRRAVHESAPAELAARFTSVLADIREERSFIHAVIATGSCLEADPGARTGQPANADGVTAANARLGELVRRAGQWSKRVQRR